MRFYLYILMAALLLSGCSHTSEAFPEPAEGTAYLSALYHEQLFLSPLQKGFRGIESRKAAGMICPHHLLASDLIHDLFLTVRENDYDNIVVIGPDHQSMNGDEIAMAGSPWKTPYGMLGTDQALIDDLLNLNHVTIDDRLMANEHSSSVMMPYISYYFQDVRVTAIAVPGTLSLEASRRFGKALAQIVDFNHSLLIASIDFSHDLDYEAACKMDQESLEMIRTVDYQTIIHSDDRHFDSSQTLIAFLACMEEIDADDMVVIGHGNAFDYIKDDNQGTTSYYTIIYQ